MGFFEILLIAVVALFVVGPERMPEAVRSVALTIGRIKRSFESARSEIEKQIGTDDIRRQLHNESIMESLNSVKEDFNQVSNSIHGPAYDYDQDDEEEDLDDLKLHEKEKSSDKENKTAATPAEAKSATK